MQELYEAKEKDVVYLQRFSRRDGHFIDERKEVITRATPSYIWIIDSQKFRRNGLPMFQTGIYNIYLKREPFSS